MSRFWLQTSEAAERKAVQKNAIMFAGYLGIGMMMMMILTGISIIINVFSYGRYYFHYHHVYYAIHGKESLLAI